MLYNSTYPHGNFCTHKYIYCIIGLGTEALDTHFKCTSSPFKDRVIKYFIHDGAVGLSGDYVQVVSFRSIKPISPHGDI